MNTAFNFGGIQAFHSGLFAMFYFGAAIAIWIYYGHVRGDKALSLQSMASGLAHVFTYLIGATDPTSQNLNLALAGYCCCASPTIMLCLREAIDPGWISWKRYFTYIGPFLFGTLLCLIFARPYIFYILIIYDFWFCCYAAYKLSKGIDKHERILKFYFAEPDYYSHDWVRLFVYFQIVNVIVFFFLYKYLSVPFNIIFNYVQAGYWLYFLLMCKKYRYYTRQIPKDILEDIDNQNQDVVEEEDEPEDESVEEDKKCPISNDKYEYIEAQLEKFIKAKKYTDSSLNITSLASLVGTNRTYLCHFFKSKNTTFCDFINECRCAYAIEVMQTQENTNMPTLANSVGYRTETNFRKSFVSIYGITPFAYRKEKLNQPADASKE